MIRVLLWVFFFLSVSTCVLAQVGGGYTYAFLNVPASARVAALGGTFISVKDNDLNCALQNPSLLNSSMSKQLLFNGVLYYDGVKFGDAAYALDFKKSGTFMANMHYAGYGDFVGTDVAGNTEGNFHAADYNLNLGWGHQMNRLFSVGATLKSIYSNYYLYSSFGMGLDFGATLDDTASQFSLGIVARNVGVQFKNYVQGYNEPLPVEVQVAASKRLIHTPFRFTLTYRHAEKFDLRYDDPNDVSNVDPLTGESEQQSYDFFDKLSTHLIISTELLFSKNFHLRGAYNFQRRQEMSIEEGSGLTGFSLGFGMKISKINIGYGFASYHTSGFANHFSIVVNLSEFVKKAS